MFKLINEFRGIERAARFPSTVVFTKRTFLINVNKNKRFPIVDNNVSQF